MALQIGIIGELVVFYGGVVEYLWLNGVDESLEQGVSGAPVGPNLVIIVDDAVDAVDQGRGGESTLGRQGGE